MRLEQLAGSNWDAFILTVVSYSTDESPTVYFSTPSLILGLFLVQVHDDHAAKNILANKSRDTCALFWADDLV